MTAVSDRSLWLAHLRYCTRCPTDLCDRGLELAAAVRDSMWYEYRGAGQSMTQDEARWRLGGGR